jgi:hypothetical protein
MKHDLERIAKAMTMDCPKCGAPAGVFCRVVSQFAQGRYDQALDVPHRERILKAHQIA